MYTPLKVEPKKLPKKQSTVSYMAKQGVNLRDLPQLLNPNYALNIENYLITTDGGLNKRKGEELLYTSTGDKKGDAIVAFTDDIDIKLTNNKLYAYDYTTAAETEIASVTGTGGSLVQYGDFVFYSNKSTAISYICRELTYDNQTGNFTAGLVVTGTTSGATGIILKDTDAGATGVLILGTISGTFQNNEPITDTSTGAALVNGTLAWATHAISGAPKAQVLAAIGARLYAGVGSSVYYSDIDLGTNPPFQNWTAGTGSDDPGVNSLRAGGDVNSIVAMGQNIVAFQDNAKFAFYIDTIDSSGTLVKVDKFVMWRFDFGGARGAISTPKGVFYCNEAGLWQLISVGQPNIPYSDQEGRASVLLGSTYFDDVDLTSCDLTFYSKYNTVLVTCAKDSTVNNHIIAYNAENKAFSFFSGWNINKWLNINDVIYGISSINGKTFQMFTGNDDDGKDIWTDYYQELTVNSMDARSMLEGGYIQAVLSPSSSISVKFDIYDVNGVFKKDVLSYTLVPTSNINGSTGWGNSSWGISSFGGDTDFPNPIETFDGFSQFIRNFQRIRIHIIEHSNLPHVINWFSLDTRAKQQIRRRKMTLN